MSDYDEPVQMTMRFRRPAGLALMAALVLVVGCQSQPTATQLEWCAENQAKVGRSADELGVYERGMIFMDWKFADPDGYDAACVHAFERG